MVDIFEKMLQIGSALAHHLGENRGSWMNFSLRDLKRVGVPVAECKLRKMCLANDVKPVKLPGASNPMRVKQNNLELESLLQCESTSLPKKN